MSKKPNSEDAHPKVKKFYRVIKSRKSRNTAYNYARDAQRLLEHSELEPEEVTPLDVRDFFEHRREKGDSESSIARYSASLKKFFKEIGQYDLSRSIEIPDYTPKEPNWIEDRDKIKELIGAGTVRDRAMLGAGYELALRAGEVPKLKAEEFFPEQNNIIVRRLKHHNKRNTYELPIRDWCVELIEEWQKKKRTGSVPLFPFTSQTANNRFKKNAAKVDVPEEYSFHCLRHSRITHYAIDMIENEGTTDLARLSKFAGHLKNETTLRYLHLASEYLEVSGPSDTEPSIPSQESF